MVDQAMTTTTVADRVDLADMERRIKAIFIGSVGNLVEWYDFYAYTAFALYFAPGVLSAERPVGAAAQRGGAVCRDVPDASAWRLAVRLYRRPLRPAAVADDLRGLHVLRLADHRGDADLRLDRARRAGDPGASPASSRV
jgi:hypothetical protein